MVKICGILKSYLYRGLLHGFLRERLNSDPNTDYVLKASCFVLDQV